MVPHGSSSSSFGGAGRTGVFVAVDYLIKEGRRLGRPLTYAEAMGVLLSMRCQRPGLVETPEQWNAALSGASHALRGLPLTDFAG